MRNETRSAEVEHYLRRLERALRGLPADRRREVIGEIDQHISEALAEVRPASDAAVLNVLQELGEPDEIAAAARDRFGIKSARPRGADWAAVILILIGGLVVPVIGWLVGVLLLWSSNVWALRDKVIGTLVVPGGLVLPALAGLMAGETCVEISGGQGIGDMTSCDRSFLAGAMGMIVLALLVIAPIATAIYLARRLRQAQDLADAAADVT